MSDLKQASPPVEETTSTMGFAAKKKAAVPYADVAIPVRNIPKLIRSRP